MKYQICKYRNAWDLEYRINSLIKEGWVPQGGLAIMCEGGVINYEWYCQAMIKVEK